MGHAVSKFVRHVPKSRAMAEGMISWGKKNQQHARVRRLAKLCTVLHSPDGEANAEYSVRAEDASHIRRSRYCSAGGVKGGGRPWVDSDELSGPAVAAAVATARRTGTGTMAPSRIGSGCGRNGIENPQAR